MNHEAIKQRFGIIGDSAALDNAISIALQVAKTDLSVLVTGESGVGKEFIPQIIHFNSPRKHNVYLSINCGAIPEGTIDSELFGHEKGAFTGATETRKGYFEEADGGTLFLDEVAELPLPTQARLLRVLQSGEFIKVGSSKVQKTNVRVVAATNIDLRRAIESGRFREDLYFRLNTVPIRMPALRDRKGDIHMLFRKFALDFASRYMMPAVRLTPDAVERLEGYGWPGNVRELKSVAERISVMETERTIDSHTLAKYLQNDLNVSLPALSGSAAADYMSDRDIIFKMIMQLKQEIEVLKERLEAMPDKGVPANRYVSPDGGLLVSEHREVEDHTYDVEEQAAQEVHHEQEGGTLSIVDNNSELIAKALEKYHGNRKLAAAELGISERTLYRKIKALGL
ncbi:MAG: sigma-54-dependent Fis family transcriptional regulator [Bacteroidales bacterium]|nr:sigma-54-dependent Fis family transcriptional regulator [Bacteroidales bacterium]MBQ7458123.1 sigma-54-dependent Fis family transcriptional regulator [Bacteroidales bacterium]